MVVGKVSVQGVGGHFATLCWELDFWETKIYFFIIDFQEENANTLLSILIVKSLQILAV